MRIGLLALVLVGALALGWFLISRSGGVDERRVNSFLARQRLELTPASAPVIVRALAVTHRWRRFGLVTGLLLAALWSMRDGRLTINFLAMFLGWFVGAVIAEWRIPAPEAQGARRRVDLTTRSLGSYVTRANRAVFWAVALVLVVTAAVSGLFIALEPGVGDRWTWAAAVGQAFVGAALLWLTVRRVVSRPVRTEPEDVHAADVALRRQGLTVLTGSAIALAGAPISDLLLPVLLQIADADAAALVTFAVFALTLLLGWYVAARSQVPPAVGGGRRDNAAVARA